MICIPVMARNNAEAFAKMAQAGNDADLFEIRLDVMESFDLAELIQKSAKPLIITYRSKKEGGSGKAGYASQAHYLSMAIELGADFVDVEYSLPLEYRQMLFSLSGTSKLIISHHHLYKTPSKDKLEALFHNMAATGAEIVKIITPARTAADNLRVLGLIPLALDLNIKIIAFCMGSMGRISRVFSLLLGSYLTFASLKSGQESAAGQIPLTEMKDLLDLFGS